jgi:GNAT superfamily N-acetyltransferase
MLPVRWVCRRLFGSYRLNQIYGMRAAPSKRCLSCAADIRTIESTASLECHNDAGIRKLAGYDGEGAFGFAAYRDGHLASACWVWTHKRFRDDRLWILSPSEAMLVEVYTVQAHRGKRLASALLTHAAAAMGERGFGMIYASIWWSNRPSVRAFQRAGWQRVGFVAELYPLGARTPLVIRRDLAPCGRRGRRFEISWRAS